MNSLKKNLVINLVAFASTRYFSSRESLDESINGVFLSLENKFLQNNTKVKINKTIITSEEELNNFMKKDSYSFAIFVPMSGAVQPWVIESSKKVEAIGLLASYVKGIFNEKLSDTLLEKNSAPAIMDIYAVLKRNHNNVMWMGDLEQVESFWKANQAVYRLKGSKLVLIGKTEPWVISATRNYEKFKKIFGVEIEVVPLEELYEIYEKISQEEVMSIKDNWLSNADKILEPKVEDVINASKLIVAMEELLEKKNADGVAIACFELLSKLNTTSCLALSYLNDSEKFVGACEGDVDSAITMLLVKALSEKPAWMANPNVQNDKTVNFVHCSAPLCACGSKANYILRNHHESSIGVSPEVELKKDQKLTLVRIGNELNDITVQNGIGLEGDKEKSCRTQLKIKIDSLQKYLDNVLGCHQVIVFDDIKEDIIITAKLLGINILA